MKRLLALCLLLLTPFPAFGAIAVDAVSGGATTGTLTFAHTATGTAVTGLMVVGCSINTGGGTDWTSVTFNGDSLTRLGTSLSNAGSLRTDFWYRKLPDVATGNIVATPNNSVPVACNAITLTGVDQATTFRTRVSGQGTGALSVDATTAVSGDLVIDTAACNVGNGGAIGANQTQRDVNRTVTTVITVFMSTQAGSDGGVMSWGTCGAVAWQQLAVPIIPASTERAGRGSIPILLGQ
jgi:hypothetical protein